MGSSVDDVLNIPFSDRDFEECMNIVKEGKPRPPLPNLVCKHKDAKTEYIRHFSVSHYDTVEWLTGCEVRSRLFCWPCLLFSKEKGVWNKHGYSDLNHLAAAVQKHERSQPHVKSFLNLKMFGKQRIDTLVDSQRKFEISRHNEQVKKNRDILKRLIDAVCYLAMQELPLRSHDEAEDSANRGNYIEFLNVLREYDPLLDSHLKASTVFRGTSDKVQNDIVNSISDVIKDAIKKEISSATFVAIILDETSEVMTKSQLSTIFRFVLNGQIHERFIGFTDLSDDRTSNGLFKHVVNKVEEFNVKDKLVGQTYDGACVMSGHINGLQSKVIETYPLALFTHCYAHDLNLVLKQSLSNIKECRMFFQTLSGLAAYFSKSPKTVNALQDFVAKKLPSISPTRWNFTSHVTNTVKCHRIQLIEFFEHIVENSEEWDVDAVIKARVFLYFLQDFQTILLLEIFSVFFGYTDILNNILQTSSYDISTFCIKVYDTVKQLWNDRKHGFDNFWLSAKKKHMVEESKPKRQKGFEEEKSACLQLYQGIIDCFCLELEERYSSLSKLEFFQLLFSERYDQYVKTFPDSILEKLKDFYGPVFDYVRLKNELKVLFSSDEFAGKPVDYLLKFLQENQLQVAFKEIYKLAELIMTIPSSTATVERSFSAMKKIHTCHRGTEMGGKLCGLSLLAIEKTLLVELKKRPSFYDDVLIQFRKNIFPSDSFFSFL